MKKQKMNKDVKRDVKLLLKLMIFAFGVLFFVAAGSYLLQQYNLKEWYFQIGMVIPLLVCIILWTRIFVNIIGD